MFLQKITKAGTAILIMMALLFTQNSAAQGWMRTYDFWQFESFFMGFQDMQQTPDGGYILMGNRPGFGWTDLILVKTDALGNEQWQSINIINGIEGFMYSVDLSPDGGYIVSGRTDGAAGGSSYVMKFDDIGTFEWASNYGLGNKSIAYEAIPTSDGGYLMVGKEISVVDLSVAYLFKLDSEGGIEWEQYYGGSDKSSFHSVIEMPDGGFAMAGTYEDTSPETFGLLVVRTDSDGVVLWDNKVAGLDTIRHNSAKQIQRAPDGNLVVGTHTRGGTPDFTTIVFGPPTIEIGLQTHPVLVKLNDSDGTVAWSNTYTGFPETAIYSMDVATDGGFILGGNTNNKFFLLKTDANGTAEWAKNVAEDDFTGFAYNTLATPDGRYTMSGNLFLASPGFILSTDSIGNLFSNQLTGTLYDDLNGNCIQDAGEQGWADRIIEILPGPLYTMTDENGDYEITVGDGIYTISTELLNPFLWTQTCPVEEYTVEFTTAYDTINDLDFGQYISNLCPVMSISVGTPLLRRCFDQNFSVTYCNEGTELAEGAYIELLFDDDIIVNSATLPWETPVVDGVYTFLLGDVAMGDCGNFSIQTMVDCDAVLGSSACVEGYIFPNNYCEEDDPAWDESSIIVTSECVGDSIQFTITNVGVGNMSNNSAYRIYEDDLLSSTGMFLLGVGESVVVSVFADGSTYRLAADQCPGHPGFSFPQAVVELCGDEPFSLGFVTTTPEDDRDHFVEIDCGTIIGSYDPNDKLVKPSGIGPLHFISPDDEMEYKIRFQNTGNDTAFTVMILDTLSAFLDAATIHTMGGSHPFDFEILGPSVLKFTFNNILLVDSTTNEPDSHGFIQFKVRQRAGNSPGTVIKNQAYIYFDFNAPILTPIVSNRIFDQPVSVFEQPKPQNHYRIYPNPSDGFIQLVSEGQVSQTPARFEIYNLLGQMVKGLDIYGTETIFIGDLKAGVYLYQVKNEQNSVGSGKLVVR